MSDPDPIEPALSPALVGLPPRERDVAAALLRGLSFSEACRVAGYAESTARARSLEICSRPRIQSAIATALADAGVDASLLVRCLREGLSASDVDGPDWSARHKFLETALRIGGHNPDRETSVEDSYEERILRLRGMVGSEG